MAATASAAAANESAHPGLFGPDGFTFKDFLDIINPLQHIPIVSTVYRAITGDTIDAGSRLAGGALFGGPIGLAVSLVSGIVEEETGKDPGEQALALLGIDLGGDKQPAAAIASADQQPQPDRVPPELVAALQPPPRQDLKMSVKMADQAEAEQDKAAERQPEDAAPDTDKNKNAAAAAAAAPAFQPAAQPEQVSADDALAMIAARARGRQPAARARASASNPAPQMADGRAWFPAFPQGGGGAPVRGVGTQPVTQQAVASKFGVRPGGYQGAAFRSDHPPPADWTERAAAAYQKYFDMQEQRNKQPGRVDVTF
ncbi:MAG TPA: hypothetical protein VF194_16540 [Ferrovibrio sp.]|uniref:hypothetical protein n=1 Tax=Ferrovibrio sp. TaxID=1917215 RepID=UPI002ED34844